MGYTAPFLLVTQASGVTTVYAPSSTVTDDLWIYPNTVATNRTGILLNGGSYIKLAMPAGIETRFNDFTSGDFLKVYYVAASNHAIIESSLDAKDLYLATTGTGVLKFGTYTAGAATDSTGYITIKDAAGNTRKLMVQA